MHRLVPPTLQPGKASPFVTPLIGIDGPERSSHIYSSGYGPTLRIVTSSGFMIEGTPHHPLLVYTDVGCRWRRLDSLQPGDDVVVSDNDCGQRSGYETVNQIISSAAETFDFVVPWNPFLYCKRLSAITTRQWIHHRYRNVGFDYDHEWTGSR